MRISRIDPRTASAPLRETPATVRRGSLLDRFVSWMRGRSLDDPRATRPYTAAMDRAWGPHATADAGLRISVDEGRPLRASGARVVRSASAPGVLRSAAPRLESPPAVSAGAAIDDVVGHLQLTMTDALTFALGAVRPFTESRLRDAGAGDQRILRDIDASVRRMGTEQLLRAYRALLSPDLVELRVALTKHVLEFPQSVAAYQLLADLNSYEGAVMTAVSERTALPAQAAPGERLKPGALAALTGADQRAAKRELDHQSDSYLRGDNRTRTAPPDATRNLEETGATPAEIAQVLRGADLTVNLPASLLLSGGAFRAGNGALVASPRLKNIYELPNAKGPWYLQRRQDIEHKLDPSAERFDRAGIDPDTHAISAGVNIGRLDGAAPGYGRVVLVLKDSVKARSTITATDSFDALEVHVTPEIVAAYELKLTAMLQPGGGLPEPQRQALAANPGALKVIRNELHSMIGQSFGPQRPFLAAFSEGPLRGVGPPGNLANFLLTNAAIPIFATAGSRHVRTFDRLEELVADLNPPTRNALVASHRNPALINQGHPYIEAQVYGGIDLAKDVAEIRFIEEDTQSMTAKELAGYRDFLAGLEQMREQLGIRVVRYRPEELAELAA